MQGRDEDPACVLSGQIYVGSANYSVEKSSLCVGVVNCAAECENRLNLPTLRLEWREVAGERLQDVREAVFAFIDEHRPCLIHCSAGQSRSTSVALLYMVQRGGMTLKAAFAELYAQRGCIQPNGELWTELCVLCDEPALTQDECKALALASPSKAASVSSLASFEAFCSAHQGKGVHCVVRDATIDASFAQRLLKPPRNVTVITLQRCRFTTDDAVERRLRSKLHIVFY